MDPFELIPHEETLMRVVVLAHEKDRMYSETTTIRTPASREEDKMIERFLA